jgi:hypothetical protein
MKTTDTRGLKRSGQIARDGGGRHAMEEGQHVAQRDESERRPAKTAHRAQLAVGQNF